VYVAPGRGRISAKKTGYGEIEGTVDVKPNGTATLTLDLAGQGSVAQGHPLGARRSLAPAYVLGGIGAVALAVGGALYAVGATKGSAADDLLLDLQTTSPNPCGTAPGCKTLANLRSGHDTFVNAGTGVLAGGGALAGAGLVYGLWAAFSTPPDRTGLTLVPVAMPVGGGLRLHGTF
jgi:hypothetical protein